MHEGGAGHFFNRAVQFTTKWTGSLEALSSAIGSRNFWPSAAALRVLAPRASNSARGTPAWNAEPVFTSTAISFPSGARYGERLHEYLQPGRLVGDIGDQPAIGREFAL